MHFGLPAATSMGKRLYLITRDPHLYLGLFFAPLVRLFNIIVYFLVRARLAG